VTKAPGRHPQARLEDTTEFRSGGFNLKAGFRTREPEVVAGAIVEVEFFVEQRGTRPFYLAVGGSRSKLRPAFFELRATLDGAEVELDDPTAEISELGGPVGAIAVEPGADYRQTLVVNEFVRLEKLRVALAEGETSGLHIHCQRPLPLAKSAEQAFETGARAPLVKSHLTVIARRDDAALERLINQLVDEVEVDQSAGATAQRETAVAKLSALRSPLAVPYLERLKGHSDSAVAMYVERALALLKRNQDA
jgi:hypothetical protein